MRDIEFFRESAVECRRMARNAATDAVRWELLLWAKEFDRIAAESSATGQRRERLTVSSFLARFAGKKRHELEAAD
jgi:hypothetical protein